MKRTILATATMFLLTTGAAMAQNPLNTTAPGPTQQRAPGQTNNDLPNPGHPLPAHDTAAPVTENGTVTGTATESIQQEDTTTGTMDTTTGSTMDNSSSMGGTMDHTTTSTTTTTNTSGTRDSLPATGSELPLVGLIGLSALAGALALRASRNA